MVLPITGPVYTAYTNNIDGSGSYQRVKYAYKQKPPYNLPTSSYRCYYTRTDEARIDGDPWTSYGGMANANTTKGPWWAYAYRCDGTTNEIVWAYDRAYGKFVSRVHDTAGTLINLHQRKQTADMLTNRLVSLGRFVRDLRRGRFDSVLRNLRSRKGANLPKTLADDFLELHFGWEPLVQDIGSAISILEAPFTDKLVVATQLTKNRWGVHNNYFPNGFWEADINVTAIARISAFVRVDSPNLFKAAALGFTNPATVAWDAIPFSFVIDWFIPVGAFLNSWSDFHGLTLVNPCVTRCGKVGTTSWYSDWATSYNPWVWKPRKLYISSSCTSLWRESSIAGPSLKLKPFSLSLTRAATSCSLVAQQLHSLMFTKPRR